jgi:uncharacterized membrane protein YqgA involved in biofilm formation
LELGSQDIPLKKDEQIINMNTFLQTFDSPTISTKVGAVICLATVASSMIDRVTGYHFESILPENDLRQLWLK